MTGRGISEMMKTLIGFNVKRSMPLLNQTTMRAWFKEHRNSSKAENPSSNDSKVVYLFCDEFTNYQDTPIGIQTVLLLERLGYEVRITQHSESGRASISKGLLRKARRIAHKNIVYLSPVISRKTPLIGVEPSAILTFRDEYLDLVDESYLKDAEELASNTFLIEEFLALEIHNQNISQEQFTAERKLIKFHAHCQQKAWNLSESSSLIMSFPKNYEVETIPSGCCGMAGSFGYEDEHYDLSMKIGGLVLFPQIINQPDTVIIAANGTSCRHQIKDGTGRMALHPVEVLFGALL
jgi:Fe-S oxidoreductase